MLRTAVRQRETKAKWQIRMHIRNSKLNTSLHFTISDIKNDTINLLHSKICIGSATPNKLSYPLFHSNSRNTWSPTFLPLDLDRRKLYIYSMYHSFNFRLCSLTDRSSGMTSSWLQIELHLHVQIKIFSGLKV